MAVGFLCLGMAAFGDTGEQEFDLPAQPLSRALERFSEQTGVSILVTSDLTRDKQSGAVRGRFTAMAALSGLLAGTGLRTRRIGESALTLVRQDNGGENGDAPPAPARVAPAYATALRRHFSERLCDRLGDQLGRVRVAVQLWISPRGRVEKVHVLDSEDAPRWGDTIRDGLLGSQLAPPPAGQPNPVTVLITPSDEAAPCAGRREG